MPGVAQGCPVPCPLPPAQIAASVLGVDVRNSFYDSEESNNCESAVVKPAHCLSFLESQHFCRWEGEGGCRAQKPAPPTSQSAACKGHSKPGALVTQAARATTRFRGPLSGGGLWADSRGTCCPGHGCGVQWEQRGLPVSAAAENNRASTHPLFHSTPHPTPAGAHLRQGWGRCHALAGHTCCLTVLHQLLPPRAHIAGVAECLGAPSCRWQPAGACEGKERQAEKPGITPQCECHRINCTNAPESARPPNPSPQGRALAGSHSLSFTLPYFLGTHWVAGGALVRGGSVSRQDLCPQI